MRFPGENQVSVMNRIESPAVDADFSHSSGFLFRTGGIDI